jgi:ribonuclease E
MSRTLLINAAEPEERRAALLEDGRLSLLWIERSDERTLVGNVYKGRVVRVEPSIGAAFIDVGLERAGFLHVDDVVHYAPGDAGEDAHLDEDGRPSIDEMLASGNEIVVQVARDPIAHKGATLTARLSFPGRTVVLLPGLGRAAVSRKIEDEDERERLRELLDSAPLPEGCGAVARTAARRASDDEILGEVSELVGRVDAMNARIAEAAAPALVHEETGFAARAVRELLVRAPEGANGPVHVVADTPDAVGDARAALEGAEHPVEVREHGDDLPLFHSFGIEREVRQLASPRVPLPGGATLVIQETEALWAIDVNSGRRRRAANLEETALETDVLAAEEIARQIRLRDLAGLIVVDFIDCREPENRARVEEAFRAALAKDPARMRVAEMSEFMVAEITRRRTRTGPGRAGSSRCPCCGGSGRVRTPASAAIAAIRDARRLAVEQRPTRLEVVCAPAVADALEKRDRILDEIERRHGVAIDVVEDPGLGQDGFDVTARRD